MNFKPKEIRITSERLRQLSGQVEERLTLLNDSKESKMSDIIQSMSEEELKDVNNLLQIAKFLLVKYENSKEMREIVRDVVGTIELSAADVEVLDDEIHELVISAENIVNKIKEVQGNISYKFDLSSEEKSLKKSPKSCPINLTNSSTEFHTYEYQQSSQEETAQVI